jgi:hypothetical protein
MSICNQCNMPFDEGNETQPVCAFCGEDNSTSDPWVEDSAEDSPNQDRSYAGIRHQKKLRARCLRCGAAAEGKSFLKCNDPKCGTTWRVNRCRICKQPVDSRDPETPRCSKCGWLICATCNGCNCRL